MRVDSLTALLVSVPDAWVLEARLESLGVASWLAFNCSDASWFMSNHPRVDMVFAGRTLSDGSWLDVCRASNLTKPGRRVVVCLDQIDGGWVDLLEWGASGVLAAPYDGCELPLVVARCRALNDSIQESDSNGTAGRGEVPRVA